MLYFVFSQPVRGDVFVYPLVSLEAVFGCQLCVAYVASKQPLLLFGAAAAASIVVGSRVVLAQVMLHEIY
jgi:hypothetical protein